MSEDDWVPWESDEPAEFEDWFLGDDLPDPSRNLAFHINHLRLPLIRDSRPDHLKRRAQPPRP